MHFPKLQRLPWLTLLTTLPLAGCATSGAAINGCEWVKPIYVSKDDVLTDGTAKQILSHDETGKQICGWGKFNQTEDSE